MRRYPLPRVKLNLRIPRATIFTRIRELNGERCALQTYQCRENTVNRVNITENFLFFLIFHWFFLNIQLRLGIILTLKLFLYQKRGWKESFALSLYEKKSEAIISFFSPPPPQYFFSDFSHIRFLTLKFRPKDFTSWKFQFNKEILEVFLVISKKNFC